MLTNHRLDQTIGAIAAAIQNLDGILFGIEEDKEIIMPKQAHLLDGLILGHRQNDELFTPTDQREQFTCLIHGHFFFHHFSG